jgi:hypothetical protein
VERDDSIDAAVILGMGKMNRVVFVERQIGCTLNVFHLQNTSVIRTNLAVKIHSDCT